MALSISDTDQLDIEVLRNNKIRFLETLKKRAQNDKELSREEKEALSYLIGLHSPGMTASSLAKVMLNIGTIYSNNNIIPNNKRYSDPHIVIQHLLRVSDSISGVDMAMIFLGLAKSSFNWKSVKGKGKFLGRLLYLLPSMDGRAVGDLLYGFGSIGASWTELSPSFKKALISSIVYHSAKFNANTLSSCLWSLARMGAKWNEFPHDLRKKLPARMVSITGNFSPRQSSKSLWALGTLGANWRDLPKGMLEKHIVNVNRIKRSQLGNAVSASQTMTGIAKIGMEWDFIRPNVQTEILETLERVCLSYNSKGIANSIWAVGTMGAPRTALTGSVKSALTEGILKVTSDSTAWALSNTIWGLTKMGYLWKDLPSKVRQSIEFNLGRIESEMNSLDIGILMWSLGSMDIPVDRLPHMLDTILCAVERLLPEMTAQDLSYTIWGLSSMGISWDVLPLHVKWGINCALRRVGTQMTLQDIACSAQGLACLCFDSEEMQDSSFRGAHEAMIATIKRAEKLPDNQFRSQESEQIGIFLHYIRALRRADDPLGLPLNPYIFGDMSSSSKTSFYNSVTPSDLPHKLFNASVYENLDGQERGITNIDTTSVHSGKNMSSSTVSRLQTRVLEGLQEAFSNSAECRKMDIILLPEFSAFDTLIPVDAAIVRNKKILAFLEVDGPHHYRDDGTIRRKDQLKEAMYKGMHPKSSFHRIRWLEANKHGAGVMGADLASIILQDTLLQDSRGSFRGRLKSSAQNLFQSLSSSFGWSSRTSSKEDL
eukprot:CAMPEP_0182425342 /NCGR_PEP_ID=MMETSP1167-20130531/11738_1 /TAXON_ID=2988 /ORGANISM="Mallomonas Sp, Strain CCMP3275" /LENGTH=768 /DNA_ID=CAMNT_0024605957 /DNA_START=165 /DNA_END=2471 /DNA_ORIENTATION=+